MAGGASIYLPNTSEVLRSAATGTLAAWRDSGVVRLEDTDTLVVNDGDYDGEELVLLGGPWGAGVVWDIKPTNSAFQSGNTLRISGLAGSFTIKWVAYGGNWYIISQRGLVSIVTT